MITQESQPTELEVTFGIGIVYGVVNVFGGAKGFVPIQAFAPTKARMHSGGATD